MSAQTGAAGCGGTPCSAPPRRLAQPLELKPHLPPRNAPPAACEKNLTGSGFLFSGVLHQLAAQLGREQDRADLGVSAQ